jgi:hypothetical protein
LVFRERIEPKVGVNIRRKYIFSEIIATNNYKKAKKILIDFNPYTFVNRYLLYRVFLDIEKVRRPLLSRVDLSAKRQPWRPTSKILKWK